MSKWAHERLMYHRLGSCVYWLVVNVEKGDSNTVFLCVCVCDRFVNAHAQKICVGITVLTLLSSKMT